MKIEKVLSILLVSTLGFIACAPKSSVDVPPAPPQVEGVQQPVKPAALPRPEDPHNPFVEGGQPGQIIVTGVIVNQDATSDSRLKITVNGGIGKAGKDQSPQTAKVMEENLPQLNRENKELDLTNEASRTILMSVGCDQAMTDGFAKDRSLQVSPLPPPFTSDFISIRAKTLLVCGDLKELNFNRVAIAADEIVLSNVRFTKVGTVGSIRISANKLVLIGENKIETKGVDGNLTISSVPTLELNVLKEVVSESEGTLSLLSSGANYDENGKPKNEDPAKDPSQHPSQQLSQEPSKDQAK